MDITLLIEFLVIVLLGMAIVWVGAKLGEMVKKIPADIRPTLDYIVEEGVKAAEQRFMRDVDASGKTKFNYALATIRAACSRNGVKFDESIIGPLIEAKVYGLFNYAKTLLD